jgi:SAM-dependent methyltransferase
MHFTEALGIAAPEIGWVPAPSYILRRSAVLHFLRHARPGRVLEIGCGGGALLYDLHRHGFTGVGIEQSARALEMAGRLLAGSPGMSVRPSMAADDEPFDYLMAFEVLEHIEDDAAALDQWAQYLRSGGTLLLSVPARMRSWSDSDVWAGHFRRYEKDELRTKVSKAGFEIERLVTYGWPLSNLVEPVRASVNRRRLHAAEKDGRNPLRDKRTQTEGSGVERQAEARLYPYYSNWLGQMVFKFFGAIQRCFFARDWGTGYILVGRKK